MKFIIEHLEPNVSEWCLIEYENISRIIGKQKVGKHNLMITNLPKRFFPKLKSLAELHEESVLKMHLKNTCVLGQKAKTALTPKDKFSYFIFGGILGDHPEQNRTEKHITSKLKQSKLINPETRNLGNMQMSTDTAVLVAKIIAKNKIPFEKIKFIDKPAIRLKQGIIDEEVILPYRYVEEKGKPRISHKLLKYLKEKEDI